MKKILLVDDEPGELKVLARCLDCKEINAEIHTAISGEEALALIKKEDISLLITDVHMPGMNGLELILSASTENPDLAFIVMTGYATAEIKRNALLRGCLRFVEKPYKVDDIRGSVIEVLAAQKGFSGTMQGIDLTDLIQLNCLSGKATALKVSDGKKSGMIFFERGNIVHAMVGDIEGDEAFYQIMAFGEGNVESRKNVKPPTRSIDTSHVALLIEGSRRRDECISQSEHEVEEAPQADVFGELAKLSGYIGAAIFKDKGEVVAVDTTKDNIDLISGGPILADFFKMATKTTDDNGLEKCVTTVIEAVEGTLVTRSAGSKEDLLLTILIEPGSNPALLQMKMAHLAPKIAAN